LSRGHCYASRGSCARRARRGGRSFIFCFFFFCFPRLRTETSVEKAPARSVDEQAQGGRTMVMHQALCPAPAPESVFDAIRWRWPHEHAAPGGVDVGLEVAIRGSSDEWLYGAYWLSATAPVSNRPRLWRGPISRKKDARRERRARSPTALSEYPYHVVLVVMFDWAMSGRTALRYTRSLQRSCRAATANARGGGRSYS
jgi:hypothetical protein